MYAKILRDVVSETRQSNSYKVTWIISSKVSCPRAEQLTPKTIPIPDLETVHLELRKKGVTLRLDHKAGEKVFGDYAGQTISLIDPTTRDQN